MGSRLAFLLVLAILLGGCAIPGTESTGSSASAGARVPGYLATSRQMVSFLQWTRTGTSLTGVLTEAYLTSSHQVGADSGPITGVLGESSVTLHTSDPNLIADYASTISGTLHGSRLVLSYPGPNGTLTTVPFHLASVSDYNAAVGELNRQAAVARQAGARATAAAVATSCAVFTNVEAEIAITIRGPGHWSICDKIVHLGKGMYDVGVGGDFDIHLYTRDCADRYARDAITVYDNGGSPRMVARACTAFLHHRLPVLDGNAR